MDMSYFRYCQGLVMTSRKFARLFGGPPRRPEAPLTQREMDMAASIQQVTEEIMLRAARHLHARDGHEKPLPGRRRGAELRGQRADPARRPFRKTLDPTGCRRRRRRLGTALFIWHQLLDNPRTPCPSDSQQGSMLGPQFSEEEIRKFARRPRRQVSPFRKRRGVVPATWPS